MRSLYKKPLLRLLTMERFEVWISNFKSSCDTANGSTKSILQLTAYLSNWQLFIPSTNLLVLFSHPATKSIVFNRRSLQSIVCLTANSLDSTLSLSLALSLDFKDCSILLDVRLFDVRIPTIWILDEPVTLAIKNSESAGEASPTTG